MWMAHNIRNGQITSCFQGFYIWSEWQGGLPTDDINGSSRGRTQSIIDGYSTKGSMQFIDRKLWRPILLRWKMRFKIWQFPSLIRLRGVMSNGTRIVLPISGEIWWEGFTTEYQTFKCGQSKRIWSRTNDRWSANARAICGRTGSRRAIQWGGNPVEHLNCREILKSTDSSSENQKAMEWYKANWYYTYHTIQDSWATLERNGSGTESLKALAGLKGRM